MIHTGHTRRTTWAAAALFAVLTLALTYPLVRNPQGTVIAHNADDEEVMWILAWDTHAFTHHPLSILDANILYPARNTLAYAENLIGSAIVAAPVMWLGGGNVVLAVNVVALVSCALCGLGAYVLGRTLGMSVAASILCGIVFAFSPPRFMRNIQLHIGAVQWIPFALASLHRYLDERRRRDLWLAVGFVTLQALTSGHGAVFTAVAVGFVLGCRVVLGQPQIVVRGVRDLGVTGLLLLAPAVLMLWPYMTAHGEVLSRSGLGNWYTTPESFFASPSHLHKAIRPLITSVNVNAAASAWLFPGYLPLLLAVVAVAWGRQPVGIDDQPGRGAWAKAAILLEVLLVLGVACAAVMTGLTPIRWPITDTITFTARSSARAWMACAVLLIVRALLLPRVPFDLSARRRLAARWAAIRRRDPVFVYFVIAVFCAWVAFGPPSRFWRLGLWRVVYDWPGLNFIRATARFMVLGLLAIAVLSGIGFDRIAARVGMASRRVLAFAVGVLLVLEFAVAPLPVSAYRIEIPAADRWLATQPAPFVVAEVPMGAGAQLRYMLHSTAHWQKTVHGEARIVPERNQDLYRELLRFPDEQSLESLEDFGVTYVVVHTDLYPPDQRAALDERLRAFPSRLTLEYSDSAGRVYSLPQRRR